MTPSTNRLHLPAPPDRRWAAAGGLGIRRSDTSLQNLTLVLLGVALVACDTLIMSRLQLFFGPEIGRVLLWVSMAIVLVFAALAYLNQQIAPLFVWLVIVAITAGELIAFAVRADVPFNYNALGTRYSVFGFIVFYELARRGLLPATMKLMFAVLLAYTAFYCVASTVLLHKIGAAAQLAGPTGSLVLSDPGRGDRLLIHHGAAAYVLMYSIARLRERITFFYLVSTAIAVAAVTMSLSRVYIGVVAAVSIIYLLTSSLKVTRSVAFASYVTISSYLLLCAFVGDSSSFLLFDRSDLSISGREIEFDIMAASIRDYPLFGIGSPDNIDSLAKYMGSVFFPSDVGIVGVCFMYGLFGVVIYGVIPEIICCFQSFEWPTPFIGPVEKRTLLLVGSCACMYQINSHALLSDTMTVVFSLIFGVSLLNRQTIGSKSGLQGKSSLIQDIQLIGGWRRRKLT